MTWAEWITPRTGADMASYFGIVLAFVGFSVTLVQLYKTKGAISAASNAVAQLKDRLYELDSVQSLSTARSLIRELKRITTSMNPGDEYILPDKCESLRTLLVEFRSITSARNQRDIQGVLVLLAEIESSIVNSRLSSIPFNPTDFYTSLAEKLDLLSGILASIRKGTI